MSVNMKVKIKFSKNIIGTCMLLQTFSDYGLKLMNSNTIAQEINANIQNHLCVNENYLPPWNWLEIGYFMILSDGGKEIQFADRKEH